MSYWIPVSESLPAAKINFWGDLFRSHPVLIVAKYEKLEPMIYLAYYKVYDNNEFPPQWKLVGRDDYDVPREVTHWMPLPELP